MYKGRGWVGFAQLSFSGSNFSTSHSVYHQPACLRLNQNPRPCTSRLPSPRRPLSRRFRPPRLVENPLRPSRRPRCLRVLRSRRRRHLRLTVSRIRRCTGPSRLP